MLKKICILILLIISTSSMLVFSQDNVVTIKKESDKWQLYVNSQNYYIKGAGGETHLDDLVASGGNTIRTWGVENAQAVLDEAQKKGIKVMLGLWVQHERHGFDYNDEVKVKNQLEGFRSSIKKYKNHPALLIWCVGNEYELDYNNKKVWKAVNDIAKMIKEEDTNHPVATVTAGVNDEKIQYIIKELTAIDIYGVNTYGDIGSVKKVLKRAKYDKPYMITEWGPNGHWESPKTSWGSSVEQTSREKAVSYKNRYEQYITADSLNCIGSFAFLWGHKQEYTSTWYGIFNEDGRKTEVYDALAECWTGKPLQNNAPSLDSIHVVGFKDLKNLIFKSNQPIEFEVFCSDKQHDNIKYEWALYPESEDLKTGGDAESKPQEIAGRLKKAKTKNCKMYAPQKEGRYRLYITASDGEKIAYCNLPFYVEETYNEEFFGKPVRMKQTDLKSFEYE